MSILIADDDAVSRQLLQGTLTRGGFPVLVATNGDEAWEIIQNEPQPPRLAILDWMMPGKEGPEICRLVRQSDRSTQTYLILLTSREDKEDLANGLDDGADDYIVKPFHPKELRARLRSGLRIVDLQLSLSERARELELALDRVQTLQGMLPICCYCKKIRDDKNYWQQVETYLESRSEATFSHGICPDCYETSVKPELEELAREANTSLEELRARQASTICPSHQEQ